MIDTAETIRNPFGSTFTLLQLQWIEAGMIHGIMKSRLTRPQRTKLRKHKKIERSNRRLGRLHGSR